MTAYTEDNLVQKTTAEYLIDALGWDECIFALHETLGLGGTLGRVREEEVVLSRYLLPALRKLNPGVGEDVCRAAMKALVETSVTMGLDAINRRKDAMLRDGIDVECTAPDGSKTMRRLRVFDFDNPGNNHFLCVREFWVAGSLGRRRRADIVGFVNGIPLVFMELKNVHKNLFVAYHDNLCDYRTVVPQLFHFNAFCILGNGIDAKIGTHSAKFKFFHAWKRLSEEELGVVDMETLLKGTCSKSNLLDLFENFIVFDESTGSAAKILARNHQFLGVNRAVEAVKNRRTGDDGRLGVFWHTQGSGKSYSMVYFARKVRRKLGGNYTFLVLTDREELDKQIYDTFAGCGLADNDKEPCRATSGGNLKTLIGTKASYLFSLIQKFNEEVLPGEAYTMRDDLIVISDEAHRTQYGQLALNMRNALPNAGYIGFTGTPLFKGDELTRRVFGDYVSTYDFQRAVDDGATVPLYYDSRGEKLKIDTANLNERIAEKLEEIEGDFDADVSARLESELKRDYEIITAPKRLDRIAEDFVRHYSTAWESGKAMLVCIDKLTCVAMYDRIARLWKERIYELEMALNREEDEQEVQFLQRQIAWMRETVMAVVVSEEQNEEEKFTRHGLDIRPHRKLMKEGFDVRRATADASRDSRLASSPPVSRLMSHARSASAERMALDEAFKCEDHPFRIAIVCAMWLTGFDVPSLGTLYLDKPLKAHTLMQAIARANRVNEGKNNGLIVDYCGILKNLRKALATFTRGTDGAVPGGEDEGGNPLQGSQKLLGELAEALSMVREWLEARHAPLSSIVNLTGFPRNAAISAAKEAANDNDETRRQFEVLCRTVFAKFKACITFPEVNGFREECKAVEIVYRSLMQGRDDADISDIMRELHAVVDAAIEPVIGGDFADESHPYDISKIDFARLRQEFARSKSKRTAVLSVKEEVERKLARMLARNPSRVDFQRHFERIVSDYNAEKDRKTIEQTFEELLKFVEALTEEEGRAVREGLDEETLAIYDLLRKPDLAPTEIARVKKVAKELLATLKADKLRIEHWQEKELARDGVRRVIGDALYGDETGLPASYSGEEVERCTETVYRHIFERYPVLPSPYYAQDVA